MSVTSRVRVSAAFSLIGTETSRSGWIALSPHWPVAVACGAPVGARPGCPGAAELPPRAKRGAAQPAWPPGADAMFWAEQLCLVAFHWDSGRARRSPPRAPHTLLPTGHGSLVRHRPSCRPDWQLPDTSTRVSRSRCLSRLLSPAPAVTPRGRWPLEGRAGQRVRGRVQQARVRPAPAASKALALLGPVSRLAGEVAELRRMVLP